MSLLAGQLSAADVLDPPENLVIDGITWLWRVTNDQDLKIIEDSQRGVESRAYEPGPYSQAEHAPNRFVTWYLEQIR